MNGLNGFLILSPFPLNFLKFLSISSFSLHFLSISSFSLHFPFISSFSLHFLAARLQGCNNSCSPGFLHTGHHTWGFKVYEIRKNDAVPEKEWVSLEHSSFFIKNVLKKNKEHKFAIVGKEPGEQNDRRRWCARLYQLEQTENATLNIKSNQDGTSGLRVSVVYGDNCHEVELSTRGEPKVFDQDDQASREKKIDRGIVVCALLAEIIALPLAICAL